MDYDSHREKPKIELFIRMPSGLVPLDNKSERIPLPPGGHGAAITYGEYLRSVADYLSASSCRAICKVLAQVPGIPELRSAESIRLISEKHGALYSVSRLEIRFGNTTSSFAVNSAFLPEQQAFLQLEYNLLRRLHREFGLPSLPRPFLSGKARLKTETTDTLIKLFIAEWFTGFHEFHLSKTGRDRENSLGIIVWQDNEKPDFLDQRRTEELYARASRILTSLLNTNTFQQVYPWHHAAGDFIINTSDESISVKLITVRGYRSLLPRKSDAGDKVLGTLHFFLNLSIRMRVDRLDGTGELVWAAAEMCLPGVIRGFSESWGQKAAESEDLPEAADMLTLFLSFSPRERLAFAQVVAQAGRIEAEEMEFLFEHLPAHVKELSSAIGDALEHLR